MMRGIVSHALKRGRFWWPTQCHMCNEWCHDILCQGCLTTHLTRGTACQLCGEEGPNPVCGRCQGQPPSWRQCVSVVNYIEPWRGLIAAYKFQALPALGKFFALQMKRDNRLLALVEHADLLVPVPLSAQRLRERGYNQSLLLARHLAAEKCLGQGLLRLRDTPAQAGLSRSERQTNLTHAFAVHPMHRQRILGKNVLVIDDVMTTGSTLHACTTTLMQAGAASVSGAMLARAQSPH